MTATWLIKTTRLSWIVGEPPHSRIGRMSKSDTGFYIANRQLYVINTLWVELLYNDNTGCNADGTTFDGTPPPNPCTSSGSTICLIQAP